MRQKKDKEIQKMISIS